LKGFLPMKKVMRNNLSYSNKWSIYHLGWISNRH
jgi:hypothetical protein